MLNLALRIMPAADDNTVLPEWKFCHLYCDNKRGSVR